MKRIFLESKRQGFTLIKLLVVLAIIAILASMLLPALGGATESGRQTEILLQWQLSLQGHYPKRKM